MKFIYSDTNKRYYTLDFYYRKRFHHKVAKIPLDGFFTCPNIDGTKGFGGCIFCRGGSAAYAKSKGISLDKQLHQGIAKIKDKWEEPLYIAYFQANTNTYDTIDNLKKRFEPILKENIIGLALGTRCDALNEDILNYLEDLNQRTNLFVELGLQTIKEDTAKMINRGHTLKEFEDAYYKLKERGIRVTVHIINGLPYETKEDMLKTVRYLNKLKVDGVKIHSLFIEKGTKIYKMYKEKPFSLLSKKEYVDITSDQIEELNKDIVIERVTGDADKEALIAPLWSLKKFSVINDIDKELKRRNTVQGFKNNLLDNLFYYFEKYLSAKDHIYIDSNLTEISTFIKEYTPSAYIFSDKDTLLEANNLSLIHIDNLDKEEINTLLSKLNNKGIITSFTYIDPKDLKNYKFTYKKINNSHLTIIYKNFIY